jgi:hypothetical protein
MKDREKLALPKQDAIDILDGEDDVFEIIEDVISGKSRWCDIHKLIIKRKSDSKFFKGSYRVGATESQDEGPWEYEKTVEFSEVFPVEKTIIVYE